MRACRLSTRPRSSGPLLARLIAVRPHRALRRRTPAEAFEARPKASAWVGDLPAHASSYWWPTCTSGSSAKTASSCGSWSLTPTGTTSPSANMERCRETGVNDVLRHHNSAPGRNRTSGTRFRKPLLYPLSYEGRRRNGPFPALRSKCSPRPRKFAIRFPVQGLYYLVSRWYISRQ